MDTLVVKFSRRPVEVNTNCSFQFTNSFKSSSLAGIHDNLLAPGRASTMDEGEYYILVPEIFDRLAMQPIVVRYHMGT